MAEKKKNTKSSSGAKKSTSARKTPAKKAPVNKVRNTKHLSSELKGIILIAIGAFLALAFFTNAAGALGGFIKSVFTGLFGSAAKVFFLYIIWMGVNTFMEKSRGEKGWKPFVLWGLMALSAVFVALCMEDTEWFSKSFVTEIKGMFEYGVDGFGGGVIGSGICRILYRFLGWGTWIVTIAALIILLVFLTETSLEKLAKKIGAKLKDKANLAKEELNREIDLDDEETEEEEEIEEIKVSKKKGRRKKEEEPTVGYENNIKSPNSDYFDLYFSEGDKKIIEKAAHIEKPERKSLDKFEFSDEALEKMGYTSDITFESEEDDTEEIFVQEMSKEKREIIYPGDENERDGILTTLPDEDGKYHTKGEEPEFEPPSLVQIEEVADPYTRAAIDSGVPLDEAVMAGRRMTKEEADAAQNMVADAARESIEATKLLNYKLPPISLLSKPKAMAKTKAEVKEELETKANKLLETLLSFKVEAKILNITQGPTVTRFELQPGFGVKVSKITHLADDIALSLAAPGVRIEAPIPGKSAIGIEIPNEKAAPVPIREVIDTDKFKEFNSKTAFALGKDISGNCIVADIAQFPHILIAGATGSGKSVCINSLIASILYKAKPNEVKLIMIDPKMVELGVYNGIPHLLIPVVTDPKHAAGALNWAVTEMKNRYKLLKDNKVRNIQGFNALMEEEGTPELKMPEIVIIIDELADLMLAAKSDVEDAINSLAALARAAGMYLVIATQRPSVDVITGVIKANVPSRISFAVSSQIDSRTILDAQGAEKLLGKGDMLYAPRGAGKPMRIQGNFLSDTEIENIIDYIKNQYEANYDESILEHIEKEQDAKAQAAEEEDSRRSDSDRDELFFKATEMFVDAGQGSVAMLQRRFKIGYQRAARLIDQLEEARILGPFEGSKPRQVLISRQEFNEMMMNQEE